MPVEMLILHRLRYNIIIIKYYLFRCDLGPSPPVTSLTGKNTYAYIVHYTVNTLDKLAISLSCYKT